MIDNQDWVAEKHNEVSLPSSSWLAAPGIKSKNAATPNFAS